MVPPLAWSGRQVAITWLGALVLAAGLWTLGSLSRPPQWKFFWLVPYEGPLRATWVVVRSFFTVRPLEATAIIGIPAILLVFTGVWVAARIVSRAQVPS